MTDPETARVRHRALRVLRVPPTEDRALVDLLRRAGLPIGRPVVVLVGGADGLTTPDRQACESVLAAALVPVVELTGAVLVDGGTDSGIIRLAGRVRARLHARAPYVGVVAEGTVHWPPDRCGGTTEIQSHGTTRLEPNHSHVVAVPGESWGDEGRWINAVAAALSADAASVTVVANGGDIAYDDVRRSLAAGRRVLVLGGTGRAAAELSNAAAGRAADRRAVALAVHPLLTVLPENPREIRTALVAALRGIGASGRPPPPAS